MKIAFEVGNDGDIILQSFKDAQMLGKLSGVFGRLVNLSSKPSHFKFEISTACGMLDYILVDTVSSGVKNLQ